MTPKAVFADLRLNTHIWDEEMDKVVDSKNKKVYDPELFTDLLLPLRIGDHWGLLIFQMELQRHVVMIFKE